LIFDETDTGVSGEIAHKFGEMMRNLGDYRQVIAITHLPQVAAHGNSHYFISKKEVAGKTESFMEKLQIEQRIQKLASMLGGENPGEAALANAKELLQAATAALS
jgi:DNA repair protein RecN (Recombination protein N)